MKKRVGEGGQGSLRGAALGGEKDAEGGKESL